jgi:iron complex outermembrane receptor protein
MPNLPTSRYGLAAALEIWKLTMNMSFDRYLKQRYLGKNINPEPPMHAYSLVSSRIAYNTKIWGYGFEYFIHGNNLFNADARPQNSFLKYLAPLPGRNIAIGIKAIL